MSNESHPQNLQAPPPPDNEPLPVPLNQRDSSRYCWVCFATEEEDREAAWVQPCNCKGTTKWVRLNRGMVELYLLGVF